MLVGSAAGSDEDDVAVRARHELVERVSNILAGRAADRAGMVVATFGKLRARRIEALDPAAWSDAPDGVRELPMSWVAGRSLVDDRDVLVPAGAAFLRHVPGPGGVRALSAGSAGVAAHVDRPQAVRHALREVLERDLVARSWVGDGRSWVATPAPVLPDVLDAALTTLGLEATAIVAPGPRGWGSIVACLHTPERGAQSFGARCIAADDGAPGFARAVFEALMVRWSMGTAVARRAREAMRERDRPALPASALEHALWTFHEQDSLGLWLERCGPPERRGPSDGDLVAAVAEHTGGDVVAVDSTVPSLAPNAVVMRVVVPGARSLPARATPGTPPHPFG